jgi:hypothetical protein
VPTAVITKDGVSPPFYEKKGPLSPKSGHMVYAKLDSLFTPKADTEKHWLGRVKIAPFMAALGVELDT